MRKYYKKGGIALLVLLVLFVVFVFAANNIAKGKIENYLSKLPNHIKLSYSDLSVNTLVGDVSLESPKLSVKGQTTGKMILNLEAREMKINDVGYYDYLFNDKISINAVKVNNPIVKYVHNPLIEQKDAKSELKSKIDQAINIGTVEVKNADVLVVNHENDSLVFNSPKSNLMVEKLRLGTKNATKGERFSVEGFSVHSKQIKYAMNKFDNLHIDSMAVSDGASYFKNLKIKTKFSKERLSQLIPVERDYYDVNFSLVEVSGQKISYSKQSKLGIKAASLTIESPKAYIYRDKLVADDPKHKPLFSKLIRELKFDLRVDTTTISDGEITYSEKVKPGVQAGTVTFKDFNATIKNICSTPKDEKQETQITVNTNFMEQSPLEVEWYFKVQDTTDSFIFKADLGHIKASDINSFSEPNLNTRFKGELQQTYFTIDGNTSFSDIDLKMKYDNFEVVVLKDNGEEKNKFLSGLINLFISNDSNKEGYRYGNVEQIQRDKTKSVFNFIWISLRGGLKSAIAEDGKKDD